MNIKPLGKNVVLEKYEVEETTASGIVLPDSAKGEDRAKVVALADKIKEKEKYTDQLSIGDTVVYNNFAGTSVEIDGTEYIVIDIKEILAVIE